MVVKNFPGGRPVVILGTDGTNLYGVLVDGAGRLQIDLVNLDDIGDIATQTTLADILTRLNAIKLTKGTLVRVTGSGVVTTGAAWTTLVSISAKGILEGFDFATDYSASEFRIGIDGQYLNLRLRDGSTAGLPRPGRLNDLSGESTFFLEDLYDDVNDYYHLHLKSPIEYNTALAVQYRQGSGENKNIAAAAFYRPIT